MNMQLYNPDEVAALIPLVISPKTMEQLYDLGIVRPMNELEDLALALARLADLAVAHDLQRT